MELSNGVRLTKESGMTNLLPFYLQVMEAILLQAILRPMERGVQIFGF